jgi:hypothetical protein
LPTDVEANRINNSGDVTVETASLDADTLVQAALEDALSLFEDKSNSNDLLRSSNSILSRFDEEVMEDEGGVFT